jgi:hypothetical protein
MFITQVCVLSSHTDPFAHGGSHVGTQVPLTQCSAAGQVTSAQLGTQVKLEKSLLGLHTSLAGQLPATQGLSTQLPP